MQKWDTLVFMLLISSLTACVGIPNLISSRYLKLYKKITMGLDDTIVADPSPMKTFYEAESILDFIELNPEKRGKWISLHLITFLNLYIGSYESLAGAIDSFNYSQITEYHFSTILNAWQYRWIDCHICDTSLWLLFRLSSLNYRCAAQLMMHMISFSGKVDRYTFPLTYPLLEKLNLFLRYSFLFQKLLSLCL